MRTQTIFDSWITYPSIFLKSEPKISKCVKCQNILPTSFLPFYCGPEKIDKISVVKSLTLVMGVKRDDKISFKTDYISTTKETLYNGFKLSIELKDDEVFIIVKQGSVKPTIIKGWSISRIVSSMKLKNTSVNESIVRTLLLNGSLKMRFNVSETKNHGTYWKV